MNAKTIFGRLSAAALAASILAGAAILPGRAAAQASDTAAAQDVADHFSSIRSMAGDFVQFDDKGRQTEGKFFIERPGKIRFEYSGTPVRVIADGANVAVNNKKLNTWDLYPLSKTPMKLLLDRRIDLSSANIQSVKQDADLTTIVMGDKSLFGSSRITMMFDPKTYDLRQWTIRDSQGRDTTVMIANVRNGVDLKDSMFKIPYIQIVQGQTGNKK